VEVFRGWFGHVILNTKVKELSTFGTPKIVEAKILNTNVEEMRF